MDPALVVPDPSKSIREGAVVVWPKDSLDEGSSWTAKIVLALAKHSGIDLAKPWNKLPAKQQDVVLYGLGRKAGRIPVNWNGRRTYQVRWEGVLPQMRRRLLKTRSEERQSYYAQFHSYRPCMGCDGSRLRAESRAVLVAGRGIADVCEVSVAETGRWTSGLLKKFSGRNKAIAGELLKEITNRLRFLTDVGLEYLSLSRLGPSLSGGESQRIQLASQIGSELSGVVYVLDEPSIGLHSRDSGKLLTTLEHLRDKGNTIIVVEHDRETIERADWIVDFGPGAGREGGEITASGTPAQIHADPNSLTGRYLCHELEIPLPAKRRVPDRERMVVVKGARANNLKDLTVEIPLGLFVCVTGVSGAGKSSLVNQILLPGLKRSLSDKAIHVGDHDSIEGAEQIDKVISIDQQPIGRTPRSNPATYVKLFDHIRTFFAQLPEALAFGFGPGRFSFNVKGGRCEGCQGSGVKQIEMHFLADVYVTCSECSGKRFNDATLRVTYQGHSISDVLALTIAEGAELFRNHPKIMRHLQTLIDVGLGYVALGQPSPTLSGGEAQRIKLSRELSKRATGRTFYVLDEPSTGLHFDDIKKLLKVLDRLVASGNTVVVIEHNLDIVKTADWVLDLGPEGGDGGGRLLVAGSPEEVARTKGSYTGKFLGELLGVKATRSRKKAKAKKRVAKKKTKKVAKQAKKKKVGKQATKTKVAKQATKTKVAKQAKKTKVAKKAKKTKVAKKAKKKVGAR
jgi:excinuclease ABC subunit A